MKDIYYTLWVLCWQQKIWLFSTLISELIFTVYPSLHPWMLSQCKERKKICRTIWRKQRCLNWKETWYIFLLAITWQRNAQRCWFQRKQCFQYNHARLLAWPPIFFLLLSSSLQPTLVRRMAQTIKTSFEMRKTVLVLVLGGNKH